MTTAAHVILVAELSDVVPQAQPMPRVTSILTQELSYQPPPHLIGQETTKRLARIFFETTDAVGQRRTKTEQRLYSGTPTQTEIHAAAEALTILKVPCAVRVLSANRELVERSETALSFNRDGWNILARAEARHQVSYELLTPAKYRAELPPLE